MKNSKINLMPWEEQLSNVRVRSNVRNHSDQILFYLRKSMAKECQVRN